MTEVSWVALEAQCSALTPVQLHRGVEEQELNIGPLLTAEASVEDVVGQAARKVLTCRQPMMPREAQKVRVTATIHLPSLLAWKGALWRDGGRAVGCGGRRSAVGPRRRHVGLMSSKSGGRECVGKGGCRRTAGLTVERLNS